MKFCRRVENDIKKKSTFSIFARRFSTSLTQCSDWLPFWAESESESHLSHIFDSEKMAESESQKNVWLWKMLESESRPSQSHDSGVTFYNKNIIRTAEIFEEFNSKKCLKNKICTVLNITSNLKMHQRKGHPIQWKAREIIIIPIKYRIITYRYHNFWQTRVVIVLSSFSFSFQSKVVVDKIKIDRLTIIMSTSFFKSPS